MPHIAIKVGQIEVTYEGDQTYIDDGLPKLLARLGDMPAFVSKSVAQQTDRAVALGDATLGHTTSQIAQLMSASTGPDLAMAAMAHLTLVKGQPKVARSDILAEMKGATAFYSENYSSNLSSILNGLIKKKQISPIGANIFGLPNGVRQEFIEKLKDE